MIKFKCTLKGKGFLVPKDRCVSCHKPVGASDLKIHVSAGSGNSWLTMDFPLCFECDEIRNRVKGIEGKRAGRGCLIALPVGLLSYFAYHFIAGLEKISWIGLIGSWLVAYLAIYYLFARKLTREQADAQDIERAKQVQSAVKLTNYQQPHSWTDGSVVIEFGNPIYAMDFQQANSWFILEEIGSET